MQYNKWSWQILGCLCLGMAFSFLGSLCSLQGSVNLCFTESEPKIKVVTTSTDLKAMAEAIGGDKLEIFSLAKGNQDLHFIEPKPSQIIKLSQAQLFIRLGLGLDNWCEPLIKKAHNPNIDIGSEGYLDASQGVKIIEVPLPDSVPADKKRELHIYGNPHYWLSPANGKVMIENICAALVKIAPQEADFFEKNKDEYLAKLDKEIKQWQKKIKPYQGTKVVTYHKSWTYFLDFFGFEESGVIEPKPGIPPSPKHLAALIKFIKDEEVKLVLVEPFYSEKAPKMLAKETGADVLVLPTSVDADKGINTYIEVFDHMIDKLIQTLSKDKENKEND